MFTSPSRYPQKHIFRSRSFMSMMFYGCLWVYVFFMLKGSTVVSKHESLKCGLVWKQATSNFDDCSSFPSFSKVAIDGISCIEKDTRVESWNTKKKNLSRNNTITYSDEPLKTWVFWELKSRASTFKLPDPARSAAGNTGQVPVWADSHVILRHMNEPVALERTGNK